MILACENQYLIKNRIQKRKKGIIMEQASFNPYATPLIIHEAQHDHRQEGEQETSRCAKITHLIISLAQLPERSIETLVGKIASIVAQKTTADESTARITLILVASGIIIEYCSSFIEQVAINDHQNTEELPAFIWAQTIPFASAIIATGMSLPLGSRFICCANRRFGSEIQIQPQFFLRMNLFSNLITATTLLTRGQHGLSPVRVGLMNGLGTIMSAGMARLIRRNNPAERLG